MQTRAETIGDESGSDEDAIWIPLVVIGCVFLLLVAIAMFIFRRRKLDVRSLSKTVNNPTYDANPAEGTVAGADQQLPTPHKLLAPKLLDLGHRASFEYGALESILPESGLTDQERIEEYLEVSGNYEGVVGAQSTSPWTSTNFQVEEIEF